MKMKLTEASCRALAVARKLGEYQDELEPAFRFYVTATAATFGLYKWSPATARPVRKSLGKWPTVTVDEARKKAKMYAAILGDGGTLEERPRAGTLSDLVDEYGKHLKARGMKEWDWVEVIVQRSFHDWLPRPISAITKSALSIRHDKITESRGKHAAARSVKALRAVFAYAEKLDLYNGPNVAKAVAVVDSKPRKRVLTSDETKKILWALDSPQFNEWVKPYFRLLMLTGVRRSNLEAARWENIDLDAGLWVVPADKSKSGEAMEVVLLPAAVELLKSRKHLSNDWVFPSTRSASGHLAEPHETWKQVLKVAEVPSDITIHDLRRTYGSILVNAKVAMPIIAKAMGHLDPATTARHYAHVSTESVREAWAGVGK